MKIITQNASAALFAKVEELNDQPHAGWKCIYFTVPAASSPFSADIVSHILAPMNGFAYFCGKEVFILHTGAHTTLVSRLSMYLWSLHSERSFVSSSPLFSTFDLFSQWTSFYRFCHKRYLETLNMSEATAEAERITVPQELLYKSHVAGYLQND